MDEKEKNDLDYIENLSYKEVSNIYDEVVLNSLQNIEIRKKELLEIELKEKDHCLRDIFSQMRGFREIAKKAFTKTMVLIGACALDLGCAVGIFNATNGNNKSIPLLLLGAALPLSFHIATNATQTIDNLKESMRCKADFTKILRTAHVECEKKAIEEELETLNSSDLLMKAFIDVQKEREKK